jgi:hypothetical protein
MSSIKTISAKLFLLIFSIALIAGCSQSNKIYDSWKNPDATKESLKFKKVVVFAHVMKTATRKAIEDQIAGRLVNTIAVPSYKVVNDDDIGKLDVVKAKLVEQGFDGALVLRLVDVEKRESYSPGIYPSYYYSFGGYYNYSFGYMYDYGGSYRTDQIVTAEVNIFSIAADKLIWSGQTMTMNPNNVEETITELSESVKNALINDGLLEKSAGN